MQFFDEKLTRMIAVLVGQLKQIIALNQTTLEKMRSADEAFIRDMAKKTGTSLVLKDRLCWTSCSMHYLGGYCLL